MIVSTQKANPNLNGTKTFYAITEKTHNMMYTDAMDRHHDKITLVPHARMTSDNTSNTNISNKLAILDNNKTISKDIVEETSNSNELFSNNYNESKSMNILSKNKKKNKYEQCLDVIENYTNNNTLKETLVLYLKFRLEKRDATFYVNQWKGMLNKLDTLASDLDTQIKIVQQSIDRGYLGFFPLAQYNKQPQKRFIDDQVTIKVENEDITNERF